MSLPHRLSKALSPTRRWLMSALIRERREEKTLDIFRTMNQEVRVPFQGRAHACLQAPSPGWDGQEAPDP